jgi:hypothetical protein
MYATFFALTCAPAIIARWEADPIAGILMPVKYSIVKDRECFKIQQSAFSNPLCSVKVESGLLDTGCLISESAARRRQDRRRYQILWWAWVELNYRPHPYQGCALAN